MLEVASGSLLSQTSTGTVAAVSGLSFQPKVIMIWGVVRDNSDGDSSDSMICFGASSGGTQRFAWSQYSVNGAILSDTNKTLVNSMCIRVIGAAAAIFLSANLTTINADGFDLNWTVVQASQYEFFYLALGGNELNARVATVNTGTGTGIFSSTTPGFQPTLNILVWHSAATNTEGVGSATSLGFAKSNTNEYMVANRSSDNVLPTVEKSIQVSSYVINSLSTLGALAERIEFTSNDATGITLNKVDAPSFSKGIGFISLSGLSSQLSTFNQKTSTGTQAVTGIPFTPKALLTFSIARATSASGQANSNYSIGCALSSSNRRAVAACGSDAQIVTSLTGRRSTEAQAITLLSDGTPTVVAEADFTSFDLLTGFTVNWGTADATAREIIYLALGDFIPAADGLFFEFFED